MCHAWLLSLLVLWTTIVYSYKETIHKNFYCFIHRYICIYVWVYITYIHIYKLQSNSTHSLTIHISLYNTSFICAIISVFIYIYIYFFVYLFIYLFICMYVGVPICSICFYLSIWYVKAYWKIIILEWMFYVRVVLYIYLTPHFKIHHMAMHPRFK